LINNFIAKWQSKIAKGAQGYIFNMCLFYVSYRLENTEKTANYVNTNVTFIKDKNVIIKIKK